MAAPNAGKQSSVARRPAAVSESKRERPSAGFGAAGVIPVLLVMTAGLGSGGGASGGSASASRRPPVAYDCQGTHQGQTRPAEILLDCLSGNVMVKTPAWRYWTATSARSSGATLWVNKCRPNCAAGHYRKYAASL